MTDTIAELRGLLGKATAGPFDHMERMGIVRALRGDVAIPLFETRTPWGDQHHGAPTVRLGGEVVFRANSEGAKSSEALKREWNNAALVSAALNALPAILDELERKTKALERIGWHELTAREAHEVAKTALSTQAAYPTGAGGGLPADVVSLVVAGREAWEFLQEHQPHDEVTAALDKALERFASRVCYDDEGDDLPEAHANPCTCGLQSGERKA